MNEVIGTLSDRQGVLRHPARRGAGPSGGINARRAADVLLAALLLAVLAPTLIGLAATLRATNRGPVLTRRRVVGRGGAEFDLLRFGAEDDTAVGRAILAGGLTDLPMLFNVLRGEMGLVGPRPATRAELDATGGPAATDAYLSVRPGLLGR